MLSIVKSMSLLGLDGYLISVQVDVAGGLPGWDIVGLPDVSVKEAKESLKVLAKKQTLKIGDTYNFKVKYVGQGKVQYTSSNSKILSIDKNTGKVKAKKAGKVTVTIKAGKITKKLSVNVKK